MERKVDPAVSFTEIFQQILNGSSGFFVYLNVLKILEEWSETFCSDIHGPQRINLAHFGDLLRFPLKVQTSLNVLMFKVKYLLDVPM